MTRVKGPGRQPPASRTAGPAPPRDPLVHGGSLRSQFGETSEAHVPDPGLSLRDDGGRPRHASRARIPGFIYSRFSNPDRGDVREAHGAARRRRGGARHRERHGGRDRLHARAGQGGRPRRRRQGAVRLLPLRRRGPAAALRRRNRRSSTATDLDQWRAAMRPNTKTLFLESPTNPLPRPRRHRGGGRDRARRRRDARRRQRLRHAAAAEPARTRGRLRRLFGDQARRRPGTLPRRRHPGVARPSSRPTSTPCCARPARRCRRSTPGCC